MRQEIWHGDCLDMLGDIDAGSVNLILADLPFGITACGWDKTIIDFDELWGELKRVRRPDAPTLLFASGVFVGQCMMSNPAEYKYKWVWEKSSATNFANANKQPMRAHEDVLVFYERHGTYNPQKWQSTPYKSRGNGGRTRRWSTWVIMVLRSIWAVRMVLGIRVMLFSLTMRTWSLGTVVVRSIRLRSLLICCVIW